MRCCRGPRVACCRLRSWRGCCCRRLPPEPPRSCQVPACRLIYWGTGVRIERRRAAQIIPMRAGRCCRGADGTTIEHRRGGGRRHMRRACSRGFERYGSSIRSGESKAERRRCRRILKIRWQRLPELRAKPCWAGVAAGAPRWHRGAATPRRSYPSSPSPPLPDAGIGVHGKSATLAV
jgi:hypothetical protein